MAKEFSPHQNMLLGIAIGDAFGAGYEFRYPDLINYQDITLDRYIKSNFPDSSNPIHNNHFPAMYTDDTQMSIGVTELLLSEKPFTKENLADKFVECYKRDSIAGYVGGFQKFLDSINSGKEFIEKINPTSERNGAAMRAVPIGLVYDRDKVVEYATINAKLTHNTPKGIASSVAVGLISHTIFYENLHYAGSMDDIMPWLYAEIPKIDSESWNYFDNVVNMKEFDPKLLFGEKHEGKGVPCDGMRTVGAVLYLMSRSYYQFPESILRNAVRLGGDTDSTASIALGCGLMHDSIDNLPKFLFDDLTNHKYGRDFLLDLGKRLEKKFPLE
jgi:ADP-ribosylglycohydrolase